MNTSWVNMIPGSPSFAPWWRWELANWSVRTGRRVPSQYSDRHVERAIRYLKARRPTRHHAVLREARRLFETRNTPRSSLVEAYLLTGEKLDVVAERSATPLAVVKVYADLYFDVRSRLATRDWIASKIIGPGVSSGFAKHAIGSLWKAFGYYSGVQVLDVIVSVSVQEALVDGLRELELPSLKIIDGRLRQSAVMAITSSMVPLHKSGIMVHDLHAQSKIINTRPKYRSVAPIVAEAVKEKSAIVMATEQLNERELISEDR